MKRFREASCTIELEDYSILDTYTENYFVPFRPNNLTREDKGIFSNAQVKLSVIQQTGKSGAIAIHCKSSTCLTFIKSLPGYVN